MLLWVIRLCSLWILSCIAIKNGVPSDLWPQNDPSCCSSLCGCCRPRKYHEFVPDPKSVHNLNGDHHHDSSAIRLHSDVRQKEEDREDSVDSDVEGIEDKRRLQPQFENKDDLESYEQRKQRAVTIKYGVLLLMFLLCTIYQGYIGVKCVTFDFLANGPSVHYETAQAVLYGVTVLCINVEIFLFKNLVEAATDLGDCIVVPSLHPHPLKQRKKVYVD